MSRSFIIVLVRWRKEPVIKKRRQKIIDWFTDKSGVFEINLTWEFQNKMSFNRGLEWGLLGWKLMILRAFL